MAPDAHGGGGRKRGAGDATEDLFRHEALAHHLNLAEEGNLLRIAPRWASGTYWLLLAVLSAGVAYLVLGFVPVYETGPAVLQIRGAAALVSPVEGTIEQVDVLPGQEVSAGQVLARFRAERERAEVQRYEGEFELQLLARLRDLSDVTAERELRRLRPELERARAALDRTVIRAPHDGAVQDVRIQAGDFLHVGEHVLSVVPLEAEYTVVAFLAGHSLPQLREDMPVRLRVSGYSYAYLSTTIESLGKQVIGPREASRYLGSEQEDTLDLRGPVVVVRCRLHGDRFVAGGEEYRVHDGMRAEAAVEVRRERLVFRLIPALRAFGRHRA